MKSAIKLCESANKKAKTANIFLLLQIKKLKLQIKLKDLQLKIVKLQIKSCKLQIRPSFKNKNE
ncbi:hypothetical protein CN601_22540 [Bacillus sp. AFS017336]|nr:hypothetical protein CN601_22540 [Bacillus sp. AFS017336]